MTKLIILFVLVTISANSAVITVEGAATGASPIANVSPTTPYNEAGFTLTPAPTTSAIFDSQRLGTVLPGDSTTVFGFSSGNTLTLTGPAPFDLDSAVIGRLVNVAGPETLDVTIVGSLVGGGTNTLTLSNLSNAAQRVIGLTKPAKRCIHRNE